MFVPIPARNRLAGNARLQKFGSRQKKKGKKKRERDEEGNKNEPLLGEIKTSSAGKNANVKTLANGGGMERNRGQRERVRRILQDVWPASPLTKGTSKRGRSGCKI